MSIEPKDVITVKFVITGEPETIEFERLSKKTNEPYVQKLTKVKVYVDAIANPWKKSGYTPGRRGQ